MAARREEDLTPKLLLSWLLTIIEAQQAVIRQQREAQSLLHGQVQLAWENGADLAAAQMRDRARLEEENLALRDEVAKARIRHS